MIQYPDYKNSLVNLTCSILSHYGAEYNHSTLPYMDLLLKKNFKNVVVMLFDGMGVDALNYHLPEQSFLRQHMITEFSSVFPPTTTAATTSIESGLTPAEHGWLGWSLYFSELDKIVNAFTNVEKGTNEWVADYHVANHYLPYKTVYEKIRETKNAKAYSVSRFGTHYVDTHETLYQEIERLCMAPDKKYIYSYWHEPDSMMHDEGCYHKSVTKVIKDINSKVEAMCGHLTDTLVIVTADHGHCHLEHYVLTDYPKLESMLKRPVSIETRATSFHIKKEFLADFKTEFLVLFGNEFILLSKDELIENQLFGDGILHEKVEDFIGDYVAIAISDKGIVQSPLSSQFKSNHAGLTDKEMSIPFIAIEL